MSGIPKSGPKGSGGAVERAPEVDVFAAVLSAKGSVDLNALKNALVPFQGVIMAKQMAGLEEGEVLVSLRLAATAMLPTIPSYNLRKIDSETISDEIKRSMIDPATGNVVAFKRENKKSQFHTLDKTGIMPSFAEAMEKINRFLPLPKNDEFRIFCNCTFDVYIVTFCVFASVFVEMLI